MGTTKKEQGFSFVEIILALTVLVIGLVPLSMLFRDIRIGVISKEANVEAAQMAQSYMNLLQLKKWDETSPGLDRYTATPSTVLGPDGELSIANYNDIDDYNGAQVDVDSKHHVSYRVWYVTLAANGTMTDSVLPTNYKAVQITVDLTGVRPGAAVATSVFSNVDSKRFD